MLNQNRFQEHYCQSDLHGIYDWAFTTIDRAGTEKYFRVIRMILVSQIKNIFPLGFNESDIYTAY